MPQAGPFAAGSIDRPIRRQAQTYRPVEAPRPFWDRVEARQESDGLAARVAREESVLQGALWDRHRQVETLLGRKVPSSLMMSGQDAQSGAGALPDADYESRIEALRREYPNLLAGIETRADLASRLSGAPSIMRYELDGGGVAFVETTSTGALWLTANDGRTGPISAFPNARPVRRTGDEPSPASMGDGSTVRPRERTLTERLTSTASDAANLNPTMAVGRWLASRGPAYDEFEDPNNPGETIRYASFGQRVVDYEDERRDAQAMLAAGDRWDGGNTSLIEKAARGGATLLGTIVGSAADPTSLIAPGRTVAGRIIGSLGVNAATDAVAQAADVGTGIEDEFRPLQTATAALAGGVIQGGFEVGGLVRNATRAGRSAEPAPVIADETPDAARAALRRVDQAGQDAARIGPQDGETFQGVQRALDDFTPPPAPQVEREIDDLFGGAEVRAAASQPATTVEYRGRPIHAGSFDPAQVAVDPARFQYKESGADGLTDRLSGVTSWDPVAAGRALMFEDADGRMYAADGHQRRGLALRLQEAGGEPIRMDGYVLRSSDGWTAADARTVAALKNIRESSGTILDAAKIFREAPDLINDTSLPITGDLVTRARALSRLSDEAFGAVAAGRIPDRYGAVIGEVAGDRADLHAGMVDLMAKADPRNLDEARALVQEARFADWVDENGLQADLFGDAPRESTVIARAKLRAAVLKQLRGDARLFASLNRNAEAIEAGGNALARDANQDRVARDLIAMASVERLSLRVGQVGDTFGDAASGVTRGELSLPDAARRIVDEIRSSQALTDAVDGERRTTLNPSPPSEQTTLALHGFDEPGAGGQAKQIEPKPEDLQAEARASQEWDDLPEVGQEQRALDVLRVCAPGVG